MATGAGRCWVAALPGLLVDLGGGAGLLRADLGGRMESVGVCVAARASRGDASGGGEARARLGCGDTSGGGGAAEG